MAPRSTKAASADTRPKEDVTCARPRTRQRLHKPSAPLSVPDINDDAAERKRVLNVLAQRRYRQRRKKGRTTGDASQSTETGDLTAGIAVHDGPSESMPSQNFASLGDGDTVDGPQGGPDATAVEDMPALNTDAIMGMALDPSWASSSTAADFLAGSSLDLAPDFTSTIDLAGYHTSSTTIDPSIFTAPSTASSSFSSSSPPSTASNTTPLSFPDTFLLPMPELTLLRGLLRVASRLGNSSEIWLPTALSPFYTGAAEASGLDVASLPAAWRPTATQRSVPHHPVLDLLPWPAARDRMISVLALPGEGGEEELREMMPLSAEVAGGGEGGGECDRALVLARLVYDLEDGAEGLRIWGGDPYEAGAWEVGQVVFERWWFMFDRGIVEQSDRWREMRGAARLSLGGGVAGGGGGGGGDGMFGLGMMIGRT